MEAQKLFQNKMVPKMEAQKLSKKEWFPKWKPKNCPKKVPKMEASRLSQKKIQNGSPKTCQKKWFPK